MTFRLGTCAIYPVKLDQPWRIQNMCRQQKLTSQKWLKVYLTGLASGSSEALHIEKQWGKVTSPRWIGEIELQLQKLFLGKKIISSLFLLRLLLASPFLNLRNAFALSNSHIQNRVLQLSHIFCWASHWEPSATKVYGDQKCACVCVCEWVCERECEYIFVCCDCV